MRTAFIAELFAQAEANPNLWLLTGDLGFSVLEAFAAKFPRRFVNVGIAEQNMVGIAAGLALSGQTVVTYSIVNFATLRCFEQIRNDVCYHAADVKIVGVGGGYTYGPQGYTHHGVEDLVAMSALPGLDVLAPGDPIEARHAIRAVLQRPGPAYVRLGKSGDPVVHTTDLDFARGRMVPVRSGADALIVTTGGLLQEALAAAMAWANAGRGQAAVWSCPWLRPFDATAIAQAAVRFPLIVTAEEGVATGGLGAAVARAVAGVSGRTARHVACAVPSEIGPSSTTPAAARAVFGLDAAGILRVLEAEPA